EACGKAEVLVRRPRVAIDAAVLAAAIRIDTRLKPDVGTVVGSDDGTSIIAQELGGRAGSLLIGPAIGVAIVANQLEAIGRSRCGAPTANHVAFHRLASGGVVN